MTSRVGVIVDRLARASALAALLVMLGSVQPLPSSAAAVSNAPPPGLARIWLYREAEPFQSTARPYVRLNGTVAGISEPGGAFYRDVPPGTYSVSVDSDGMDVYQFATVALAQGQTAYVQVQSLRGWDSGGGGNRGGGGWERDTFYTRLIAPAAGEAQISRLPFYGGG